MKSVLVSKENSLATFTMEFTGEEFDKATNDAFVKLRGRFAIDGFRKGKAPRSIIEKRYGEGVFFEEAIDTLLNDNYSTTLDELGIDALENPDVQFGEEKFEKGKGFTVTLKVTVPPDVKIENYKGVEVEQVVRKAGAKDVDAELKSMQERNSRLVSVDKAAENGDTVVLNYKGFADGKQFEGGTAEDQTLELGSGTFIPGFEEQLVGIKAGEAKDVLVTFPEEYHSEELAGKDAKFECYVKEVKHKEVPELDDEFAKDASEFDTLKELKADIKKKVQKSYDEQTKYEVQSAIVEKLIDANPFDVPAVMVEREIDSMVEDMNNQMQYQGLNIDTYCKYMGITIEQLRGNMKKDAEARAKTMLVVKAVEAAEKIEATEADLEAEYKKMAEMYKMDIEKVKEALGGKSGQAMLKEDIANRKTMDFLYDNAVISDVKVEEKAEKTEKAPAKKTAAKKTTKKAEE